MVSGKIDKFYGEARVLEQPYIKDDKATVSQYVQKREKDAGCEYVITGFTRFKLGEWHREEERRLRRRVASYTKWTAFIAGEKGRREPVLFCSSACLLRAFDSQQHQSGPNPRAWLHV